VLLFSLIHATCPAHLTFLIFISLIILSEEYKLGSSSLCSSLHPPVTSFLFGPKKNLRTLYSNYLQPVFPRVNVSFLSIYF
jgi:hypothetical protein